MTPLMVSLSAGPGSRARKATALGGMVGGEKPGSWASVTGPFQLLEPPVFCTAPVPKIPVPESRSVWLATVMPPCICSWAPSSTTAVVPASPSAIAF